MDAEVPSDTAMIRCWSMKSKSIWKARSPRGINDVVSPRGVTYSVTFHQWLVIGVDSIRTLPTICVHNCKVSRVPCHSASGSAGHTPSSLMSIIMSHPNVGPHSGSPVSPMLRGTQHRAHSRSDDAEVAL